MKKIALNLSAVCLAAISQMPIVAWADDLEIKTCGPSDLRPSITVDNPSDRILLSEEPNGEEKPYSRRGSYVVIKLHEPMPPDITTVKVTEANRKPRISQEVSSVLSAAQADRISQPQNGMQLLSMVLPAGSTPKNDDFPCIKYQQQYERSEITVDFPGKSKKTFIAGPAEYMYLSADMPVTKAKQLKFDPQTNKVVEANVPQSFYLGLNIKTGDVYTDAADANFYNNLSFKLLIQITAPSNSYGYGLGYDFGPVNVFAARIYTKNDSSVSSPTSSTSLSTIFGVSFNIENGIKWLSGK